MIAPIMAVMIASQPTSVPVERRSEVQSRLTIPDEIAPAIVPYVRCRIASAGIEIRSSVGGSVERPFAAVGADCTQVRQQAAAQADQMLRDQRRDSEAERRALIERTLISVDNFIPAPATSPPNQSSPEQ